QVSDTLTANTIAGSFTVGVTVNNGSNPTGVFHLTNVPDVPASLVLGGNGQAAQLGHVYANVLTVTVLDAYSNPIPNITVTFTPPVSGPGGTLSATSGTTNSSGQVAETLTANFSPGSFTIGVAATGGTNPSGTFLLNNKPFTVSAPTVTAVTE